MAEKALHDVASASVPSFTSQYMPSSLYPRVILTYLQFLKLKEAPSPLHFRICLHLCLESSSSASPYQRIPHSF